jgi:ABC-type polysaccharide/polyol phosphate export permease
MRRFFDATIETLKITPIWYFMTYQDIVGRYRRTTLGPWWVTISTGISLTAMGVVWSTLFQMRLGTLFPYMAPGLVIWTFIAAVLTEGTLLFCSAGGMAKNIKIPLFTFVFSFILRILYTLLQNSIIIVLVFLIFKVSVTPKAFLSLIGLVLLVLASLPTTIILAMLGARFRDFSQIIGSVITFLMLLTPIMWDVSILKGKAVYIAYLNPITYFVMLIREPLLNRTPDIIYYYGAFSITAILMVLSAFVYSKYERRIIYWV